MSSRTLLDKIWEAHEVRAEREDAPAVLYVDLHLIHEVTSPQAFEMLQRRGLTVHRPERTLATMDHATPTVLDRRGELRFDDPLARRMVSRLARNCSRSGIPLHGLYSQQRGIVHVVAPELGRTQPGMTIVCGDSHTSTHGALGALAFGIGTSQVAQVLATQSLLQRKPRNTRVCIGGRLAEGVTAKDVALGLIHQIGVGGGTGQVFEFCGPVVEGFDIEQRMTLCNMSIEAGARAGLVAPDQTTFSYLHGRPGCPTGPGWEAAVTHWSRLSSDPGARFDRVLELDVTRLTPRITWGTHPGMSIPVDGRIPGEAPASALEYMGLEAGQPIAGQLVDVVFVGSCTNGRLSDLRQAAQLLEGRKVASHVRMLVVPGSGDVRRHAEAEGLDRIFRAAGAEWREPGCSMCIGMNGDRLEAGQYAVSTSNRNFEGRQGPGGRTFLASPATAAAAALAGRIVDPRGYLR